MKNIVCTLMLLAVLTGTGVAQSFNKGGRTALQFLKIGVGARQTAMGEACIAGVNDVNAVFWNPAGLTGVRNLEASFSYSSWFAGLKYIGGAFAYRWGDWGTFAFSYTNLEYGAIEEALVFVPGGGSDTRTGRTFTGSDMLLGFSYSRDFTDRLTIGGTVKYVEERLFTHRAHVFSFDVGTYYNTGLKGIRVAMAAQNFSGSVKWLAYSDRYEGYDIPLIYRIGASAEILGAQDAFVDFGAMHAFTLTVDAIHTNDYAERLHVGGEYRFSDFLALRAGYKFNYEEGNLSFGLGIRQELAGAELQADYSYVSFTYLESPHRLTLTLRY